MLLCISNTDCTGIVILTGSKDLSPVEVNCLCATAKKNRIRKIRHYQAHTNTLIYWKSIGFQFTHMTGSEPKQEIDLFTDKSEQFVRSNRQQHFALIVIDFFVSSVGDDSVEKFALLSL